MDTTRSGHILIGTERIREGTLHTWITPATFTDNGLAMHHEIGAFGDGYAVTHVSSGLKLRGGMKKYQAKALLMLLAKEDWTFAANRVTYDHATRVREAFDEACRTRTPRSRKAA